MEQKPSSVLWEVKTPSPSMYDCFVSLHIHLSWQYSTLRHRQNQRGPKQYLGIRIFKPIPFNLIPKIPTQPPLGTPTSSKPTPTKSTKPVPNSPPTPEELMTCNGQWYCDCQKCDEEYRHNHEVGYFGCSGLSDCECLECEDDNEDLCSGEWDCGCWECQFQRENAALSRSALE